MKEIKIESNFSLGDGVILSEKQIALAVIRGINRTMTSVRKFSAKIIKNEYPTMKIGEIKKDQMKITKARSTAPRGTFLNFNDVEGILHLSDKPLPMIKLVKGSKKPRKQAGRKIASRGKVKVNITKKIFTIKRGFIARIRVKGSDSVNNVFVRRKHGKDGKIKGSSAPSVGLTFFRDGQAETIGRIGQKRFSKTVDHELSFRASKAILKASNRKMNRIT